MTGVVRWLLIDLVPWLREEFRVSVIEATVGRELRALGFRKLSARPRRDARDPEAAEAFKKAQLAFAMHMGCPVGVRPVTELRTERGVGSLGRMAR